MCEFNFEFLEITCHALLANTPTIQTFRIMGTIIGTLGCIFTKMSRKTFATNALKVTFFRLDACATVQTRRRLTLIDNLFAIISAESRPTFAGVTAVVIKADAVVLTWISGTFIDILLAQISNVASSAAITRESGNFINAKSIILTRLRFTIVDVNFAIATGEAFQTLTFISFALRWNPTRSVIEARILVTQWMRLYKRLTESTGEII